jgi:hypothetical protein
MLAYDTGNYKAISFFNSSICSLSWLFQTAYQSISGTTLSCSKTTLGWTPHPALHCSSKSKEKLLYNVVGLDVSFSMAWILATWTTCCFLTRSCIYLSPFLLCPLLLPLRFILRTVTHPSRHSSDVISTLNISLTLSGHYHETDHLGYVLNLT